MSVMTRRYVSKATAVETPVRIWLVPFITLVLLLSFKLSHLSVLYMMLLLLYHKTIDISRLFTERLIYMARKLSEKLKALIDGLDSVEKDDIYRYLWAEHVREDAESHLMSNYEDVVTDENGETDEYRINIIADQVADRYVYDGYYDCNNAYWDNIDNLIEDAIHYLGCDE